ncbi:NADPH-dependent FMN reductase [Winogradskyella sp.]|uniref:NADPH-dependent FMN reductase n=1 Tax=Winogradskyella sp. TaxID=1883156 RepID=UPI00262B2E5A|nr:NAD(P)H-dependent oxidoreductase [Winogradskyella sp.]
MRLLGVSGGPTQSSKTLLAVKTSLNYAKAYDETVETEVVNVSEYNVQFCDARDPAKYEGDSKLLIDKIISADALIFGTPMYRGTYTGILKNLFDLIPNDAILGKPVGLIATGGSDHHYLALEHELKPLLGFFLAIVLPGVVYANNQHYTNGELSSDEIKDKLKQLGTSIVNFHRMMPDDKYSIIGALGPTIKRKSLSDK